MSTQASTEGVPLRRSSSRPPRPTTIPCTNPATGAALGDAAVYTPEEVRAVVGRARAAQERWGRASLRERARVLRTVLDIVLRDADELVGEVVRDAGKTRENALLGEIWPVAEKLRTTLGHAERYLRPERVSPGLLLHKKATIHYEPLGVIGVICPWNYPLQNVLGPAVPALMAGNAVVAKVSEWTSASAPRIQAIFDEAFAAHGYSEDLVRVITGTGETGAALVNGGVDKVIFTGSMQNGRRVLAASAETLTPVILELGGKDAVIVCDDADVEQAVHAAVAGAFITAGQSCLAAERILVFDGVYDAFERRALEVVRDLRQGPPQGNQPAPVDVGAMTTPAQVEIVERLVNDAVARGARVLVGGKRGPGPGSFFQPTLLVDVTPDMAIMQEETFGPVLVLCRVRDEDEAIRLTNATQYGLGCTVMTRDRRRAARIARAVRTGSVCVNDFGLAYMANELPFGGVGGSGFGRLNGREGLRACCHVKSVMTDRFPLHQPTRLFPVGARDYDLFNGAIRLLYQRGVGSKARAVVDLVRALRDGQGTR